MTVPQPTLPAQMVRPIARDDSHSERRAPPEHFDVIIVGAGLSGIGAAVHLQKRCPGKSYVILEGRQAIGGTWDLFRYPGVRSDSDMYTLGYSFKRWTGARAIADGPSILNYIRETAVEHEILPHIQFEHRVRKASWSTEDARWLVEAECDGQPLQFTANYLLLCAGYYKYEEGYSPEWPGMDQFSGRVIHPQQWPQDLDCTDQRIVVIGSGATAVTLIPALAQTAAHVVMLQRSPTYIISLPARDRWARWFHALLPGRWAYQAARWKTVFQQLAVFHLARRRPKQTGEYLIEQVRKQLGVDYDVETHFTPNYKPWDQRLCLVPDNDLFATLKSGLAEMVTDEIETFTAAGIKLKSGRELPADIVVTATGLVLQPAGGIRVSVDGTTVDWGQMLTYKGVMCCDVPNLGFVLGYTNLAWTLKAELAAQYFCRMINYMDRRDYVQFIPRHPDRRDEMQPIFDFSSGYVRRGIGMFPKQGGAAPWRASQNYLLDSLNLRFGPLRTSSMEFRKRERGT